MTIGSRPRACTVARGGFRSPRAVVASQLWGVERRPYAGALATRASPSVEGRHEPVDGLASPAMTKGIRDQPGFSRPSRRAISASSDSRSAKGSSTFGGGLTLELAVPFCGRGRRVADLLRPVGRRRAEAAASSRQAAAARGALGAAGARRRRRCARLRFRGRDCRSRLLRTRRRARATRRRR